MSRKLSAGRAKARAELLRAFARPALEGAMKELVSACDVDQERRGSAHGAALIARLDSDDQRREDVELCAR